MEAKTQQSEKEEDVEGVSVAVEEGGKKKVKGKEDEDGEEEEM